MKKKPDNAYAGMRQNFALLAQDAMRLADLQMQLLSLDVQAFWERARWGLVLCIAGSVTLLAALPVLLLSLSEFIRVQTDMAMETSMALVAGVSILLAALALWISMRLLTRAGGSLERSQEELRANIAWLRSALGNDEEEKEGLR